MDDAEDVSGLGETLLSLSVSKSGDIDGAEHVSGLGETLLSLSVSKFGDIDGAEDVSGLGGNLLQTPPKQRYSFVMHGLVYVHEEKRSGFKMPFRNTDVW